MPWTVTILAAEMHAFMRKTTNVQPIIGQVMGLFLHKTTLTVFFSSVVVSNNLLFAFYRYKICYFFFFFFLLFITFYNKIFCNRRKKKTFFFSYLIRLRVFYSIFFLFLFISHSFADYHSQRSSIHRF